MKNPKNKGGSFERKIARKLSLWVTDGVDDSALWRSDDSGARATRSGDINLVNQCGDIKADSKKGFELTNRFYVELKHYSDIKIDQLIWQKNKQNNVYGWWLKYTKEAKKYGLDLMLICKQNNRKELLLFKKSFKDIFEIENYNILAIINSLDMHIMYLDDFLDTYDFKLVYL